MLAQEYVKSETVSTLFSLGVTIEGISKLIPADSSVPDVHKDFALLTEYYQNLPLAIADIVPKFSTWLWTLLAEISVPEALGTSLNDPWPVLIFPFADSYVQNISDFIHQNRGQVTKTEKIWMSPLLHACLYAGQAWYPSLKNVYVSQLGGEKSAATLLWFVMGPGCSATAASLARKLQIHLRPSLPAHEEAVPGKLYPGIFKSFHTPQLCNVDVHRLLLDMECWR